MAKEFYGSFAILFNVKAWNLLRHANQLFLFWKASDNHQMSYNNFPFVLVLHNFYGIFYHHANKTGVSIMRKHS